MVLTRLNGLHCHTGYSWKTNQYGLTLDTIEGYELVLPNGTVTSVTAANKDLFFALKVSECDRVVVFLEIDGLSSRVDSITSGLSPSLS